VIVVATSIIFTGTRLTYSMHQVRQLAYFVTLTVGKY